MKILAIRTDQPEAQIYLLDGNKIINQDIWLAHRQLSNTIFERIGSLIDENWSSIKGVAVYRGPGSFTGLRIGVSVAAGLAYGLETPIVSDVGDDWLAKCAKKLLNNKDEPVVEIFYGQPANITEPRK